MVSMKTSSSLYCHFPAVLALVMPLVLKGNPALVIFLFVRIKAENSEERYGQILK